MRTHGCLDVIARDQRIALLYYYGLEDVAKVPQVPLVREQDAWFTACGRGDGRDFAKMVFQACNLQFVDNVEARITQKGELALTAIQIGARL